MHQNPDDFVITRKRKKYKFAKFANAGNCFELHDWPTKAVDVVEIGAGTGLFSVELAARYPDKLFLAVDVKADRLQKGAYQALERAVDNVLFLRARADQLSEFISPSSLEQVWLTFPDPFPKQRSASRRLTHVNFLKLYADSLQPGGSLYLKHDNADFFNWSLEQLVAERWWINQLSFDLYDSNLPGDYQIMTTFEQRWLGEGRQTQFVAASPKKLD